MFLHLSQRQSARGAIRTLQGPGWVGRHSCTTTRQFGRSADFVVHPFEECCCDLDRLLSDQALTQLTTSGDLLFSFGQHTASTKSCSHAHDITAHRCERTLSSSTNGALPCLVPRFPKLNPQRDVVGCGSTHGGVQHTAMCVRSYDQAVRAPGCFHRSAFGTSASPRGVVDRMEIA